MQKEIKTWEEANSQLPMLTFDLGQSAKIIKEYFDAGLYLVFTKRNYYIWKLKKGV